MARLEKEHFTGRKRRSVGALLSLIFLFGCGFADAQTVKNALWTDFSESIARAQMADSPLLSPSETIPEVMPETVPAYYFDENQSAFPPVSDEAFDPSAEYPVTLYDHWTDGENPAYTAQFLPQGVLYPAYLAGRKESRLESVFTHEADYGWLWDISLGGRAPLFRYGTSDPVQPEGVQIDMEGAALLRLDLERDRSLAATDYRAGLPLTYGTKHWQFKFSYYHVSSHLGDDYLLERFRPKKHYVRDELVLGAAFRPISSVRLYGEAGWAFHTGDTTEPWEFQFGAEYSPAYDVSVAKRGTPFAAVNAHLFEELDFGGYLNLQVGWQWRGATNHLLRIGAEFYDGCDDQFQYHYLHQRKIGLGLWYDF